MRRTASSSLGCRGSAAVLAGACAFDAFEGLAEPEAVGVADLAGDGVERVVGLAQLAAGTTEETVDLFTRLLTRVHDGEYSGMSDGVRRAAGRKPRDFSEYVKTAAAAGAWNA